MTRSTVLIVSPHDDIHALAVSRAICERNHDYRVVIVDGRDFPMNMKLSIKNGGWTLKTASDVVHSSEVCGLWYRRPRAPRVDESIQDAAARQFSLRECGHAFDFISMTMEYKVVNRPDRQFLANRKPYQLSVAQECGLLVPEYNITNDPACVSSILRTHGENSFVFKTLSAPVHTAGETRFLKESHRSVEQSVAHAPVIFQKAVTRNRELRVSVIGAKIFAHEILIHNDAVKTLPDWRLDCTAESRDVALPDDLLSKVRNLMSKLGLHYGAIDLIEGPDGQVYFLEVNPQGQFLFNEIDTGAPMSYAFAELLVEREVDLPKS